jgi:biopolymer transport protein ExbD
MSAAAWGASPVPVLAGLEDLEPRARCDTSPFAGIALVLLIIFMGVTPAPGGPYLPKAPTARVVREGMPSMGVDEREAFYVAGRAVGDADLLDAVRAELATYPDQDMVMLTGDRYADYRRVEQLLGTVSAAGGRRVLLEAYVPLGARVAPSPSPR